MKILKGYFIYLFFLDIREDKELGMLGLGIAFRVFSWLCFIYAALQGVAIFKGWR